VATPSPTAMPYPRTNTAQLPAPVPTPSAHPARPHGAYDPQGI
jgi:hypothetical protein